MRSLLFSPGNDAAKIHKAFQTGADAVILDLEDSVALPDKDKARATTAEYLAGRVDRSGPRALVRINGLDTGLADADLERIVPARPDGLVIPKTQGVEDLDILSKKLAALEAEAGLDEPLRVIAIATETARALFTMGSYARADSRLEGLTWGAEDLSAELGASAKRDEQGRYLPPYELARTLCLTGAVAANVTPIDTVFVNYRDDEGLRAECVAAARDGFTAKLAIHPAQVPVINQAFTPSDAEIGRAQKIVAAFAHAGNAGVVGLDGEMLDAPHKARAQRLLARAARYGLT